MLGSRGSCLGWLEQVGRLTVDLAVHDLLETTHHDPGVHGALFTQLGAVGVVDGLANLPDVRNPVQHAFNWAWSVEAVKVVLVLSLSICRFLRFSGFSSSFFFSFSRDVLGVLSRVRIGVGVRVRIGVGVRVRIGVGVRVGVRGRNDVSQGASLSECLAQVGFGERLLRERIDGGSHGREGKRACGRKKFKVHGLVSNLVFCF